MFVHMNTQTCKQYVVQYIFTCGVYIYIIKVIHIYLELFIYCFDYKYTLTTYHISKRQILFGNPWISGSWCTQGDDMPPELPRARPTLVSWALVVHIPTAPLVTGHLWHVHQGSRKGFDPQPCRNGTCILLWFSISTPTPDSVSVGKSHGCCKHSCHSCPRSSAAVPQLYSWSSGESGINGLLVGSPTGPRQRRVAGDCWEPLGPASAQFCGGVHGISREDIGRWVVMQLKNDKHI